MDRRVVPRGVDRRTFLLGSLAGAGAIALGLAGCVPEPPPSPTPSPTPTPVPTPDGLRPSAFHRSNWTSDPFSRGAFSFASVGTTSELRDSLATPVGGQLFFAGEATSVEAPATLQGAYESGLRVAGQVAAEALSGERVVIVGAGLAGLTAARALADSDLEIVVVDGRERIGGRILSLDDDGAELPVELGAGFVDGSATDFIADLEAAGVVTVPFDARPEARTTDGEAVAIPATGAEAVAAAVAWASEAPFDASLAAALARSGADALSAEPDDAGVSERDWLDHTLRTAVEPVTGASPSRLSALELEFPPPAETRLVTSRLGDYIEGLARGLEVMTSAAVTQIAYGDERVGLRFDSGESLLADRVIVTAPIGVLKSDTIAFSPPLPLRQQRAISVLGAGHLDVAWLRFDEAFWRTDAASGPEAPGDADTGGADASPGADPTVLTVVGSAPGTGAAAGSVEPPAVAAWLDLGAADGSGQPVLLALVAARAAERLAELGDAEFLDIVMADLGPYLPAGERLPVSES